MPHADIKIRLQPRSSKQKIVVEGGQIKAWVTSPPLDGEANKALLELLSNAIDRPLRDLEIVRGTTSREKTVRILELTDKEMWELLKKFS
jgi:uncharacterized protein